MTSLRVGVSGCGAASRRAVLGVRLHDDCDVVAVHDEDPGAAATFAGEHGLGFHTGDFAALLAQGIDFVLLTGRAQPRLAQVELAAEQAVHCLVTAPLAADLDAARAMAVACEAADVRLGVVVPELADPVFEQLRRMIASDWLGSVVAVQAMAGDAAMLANPRAPLDVKDPFFAVVASKLHLAAWLLGRGVAQVTAQTLHTFRPDLADAAAATATLRGGGVGTFVGSRMSEASAIAVLGTNGGIRIAGDRLWLVGRNEHRGTLFDYLVPNREVSVTRDELASALAAASPRAEPCGRFARWIEDTDDFPCPIEQALADLAVTDAMRRAAASGGTEAVR